MKRKGLTSLLFVVIFAVGAFAATLAVGNSPQLGLDLQGGVSVVLQPKSQATSAQLEETISIISSRVDALGVAEPQITRQGKSIVVQLPGVKNQRRALEILGTTAELRFRPVLAAIPGDITKKTTTTKAGAATTTTAAGATTTTAAGATTTTAAVSNLRQGTTTTTSAAPSTTATTVTTATTATTATDVPQPTPKVTPREQDDPKQTVILQSFDSTSGKVEETFELGPSLLTGKALESASAQLNQNTGQWFVSVVFKGGQNGIDTFNQIAAACNGKDPQTCPTGRLAIVLDSVVKSAPTINQPSYKRDQISIEGKFSQKEAKDLALVLRYGALPIVLEPVTQQTVSPSLGKDSLHAGIIAGIGGLIAVALYMILYYRALGLVVIVGLMVWSALNFSIISYLGATQGLALSLAGVTGIIVSVGVTVDSYVVYFERLKDEVRNGRTLRSSTERAFTRAFRTILAADISSFIGASLLYTLTVGPVRGFAFFLGLSTILDVFTAYFFTRPLVAILGRNRVFTEARWLGVARGMQARVVAPTGAGR